MSKLTSFVAAATLAISLGLSAFAPPAHAEIDSGILVYDIWENGRIVGEVYRNDANPEHYVEHWVLYPGYIYPSAENGLSIEITKGTKQYRSVQDFFARVPFAKGSRYVKTECFDGTALPTAELEQQQ
jgi:hypothetical protein